MIKLTIFDRDDTLNVDVGFTHKLEDLEIVKDAKDVCRFIKEKNLFICSGNKSVWYWRRIIYGRGNASV